MAAVVKAVSSFDQPEVDLSLSPRVNSGTEEIEAIPCHFVNPPEIFIWEALSNNVKKVRFLIFIDWCRVCSQILPAFCVLSNSLPNFSFIYADIDECPETTQHIRYTPTFQFYRDGEKVDEMFGAGEERLHDRLWLHS
nr:thioredoxin-like 3-3 [Ziziphus jujuba var. spinosa]